MPLQFINIDNSRVEFANPEKDPENRFESLEDENAHLWFENMTLDAKVDEETSALWFEIMMGGME